MAEGSLEFTEAVLLSVYDFILEFGAPIWSFLSSGRFSVQAPDTPDSRGNFLVCKPFLLNASILFVKIVFQCQKLVGQVSR